MTARLTTRIVADADPVRSDVLRVLETVYDHVAVPDDGTTPDCVVAVAPLPDSEWDALGDRDGVPLVVLTTPSDAPSVRPRASEVDATDLVVADEDRYTALANRVRGVVQGRRTCDDSPAPDVPADGRYLRDLYDVATDETLPFEEKADRILGIGLDRLGVENAHLSTIDRDPERYEVVASVGQLPIEPSELMDLPTTFCRRTIESEDVLAFNHAAEQGWADDPAYEEHDIECYLGARITVGGSLYGTVCFMDRSPHGPFSEAEQAFVSLVARWLSHELERTRRGAALDALHDGTADLMRATTVESVCDTAAGVAVATLDAPRTRVWLVDDGPGTTLRAAASHGCPTDPDPLDRADGEGERLWEALDGGELCQYHDADGLDGTGFTGTSRSLLVVPLGTEGVLVAGSGTTAAFDEIHRSMAGMLGSNVVAALERTEWIDRLRTARERFRRMFESASDGLLLVEPDADAIVDCNDRVCELLGYDRSNLRTIALSTICRDDLEEFRRLVATALDAGRARADDLLLRHRDGGRIPVEVSAAQLELDGQDHVLASIRDVRDRNHREQALSVFNRVLRHNIRNDMNVIIGRASMLEDALASGDQQAHLARILETARNLTELGEKARTFGQLDDRDPDADSVEIGPLIDRVRDSLTTEYPDARLVVRGDADAVAAVEPTLDVAVRELLENAIKHATTDAPTVEVDIDSDGDAVTIRIADEGPGLPEQDRAVLAGGSETPLDHGSGLGLWLANWVVTAAGGSISVPEAGPDGSVVVMSLPVGPGATADR
ncbi:PAS domain S-box-containing protein [Halorientalis persicus]|uniref:histidine kinase n=1 Tax=Halorientalis persicus TaxID=1367881 RepID=A0A1H8KSY4_9EURY|nr:ATP-binding protein [Halorientalis persicus]SEN95987.1 PAS domain S-box-containing protein [Halorientalis persicus]